MVSLKKKKEEGEKSFSPSQQAVIDKSILSVYDRCHIQKPQHTGVIIHLFVPLPVCTKKVNKRNYYCLPDAWLLLGSDLTISQTDV